MPIKWKKSNRFNPKLILGKIEEVRTVSSDGSVAFSSFEIEEYLPILESHLDFPPVTIGMDTSSLVWKALGKTPSPLTEESFIRNLNESLSSLLATREQKYILLTAISIDRTEIPKSLTIDGALMRFLDSNYPTRFRKARSDLLEENQGWGGVQTPKNYCRVTVSVSAKSPNSAVHKAMRSLDIQRGLWCLLTNHAMQLSFGASSFEPINVVRLGGQHTLHVPTGECAISTIWYEPAFEPTTIARLTNSEDIQRRCTYALQGMAKSSYGESVRSSLIRYVRALDERDANTAFLRLWGAVESLTTPGIASYDDVVRRCSFLYSDVQYHRQLLEHLRAYRNSNVHAGEESQKARTYCYQLQRVYRALFWFHIKNSNFFNSLDEANSFLDLPEKRSDLERRSKLIRKALKFLSP